jgi:DMSO reductase anchor subunit
MKPAWSVVLFTTLAGAGQGLFLALVAGRASGSLAAAGSAASLLLLAGGLAASFFHLGHPERAWRSAAMWRTSWLSREVILLPVFMAAVFAWGAAHYLGVSEGITFPLGIGAALLAVALFVCTGMIYTCLRFLQEWHTPLTVVNYALLGTASGLTLAAVLQPSYVPAALLAGAVAYLMRIASLARNARLRPRSTLASAIGVKHPRIAQIAQGAMGGSFNTREFFHGRPREAMRAVRWTFLALLFPVPAALLFSGQETLAFALQFAGLLAERWYFFAEARHPQNLYYQAIA